MYAFLSQSNKNKIVLWGGIRYKNRKLHLLHNPDNFVGMSYDFDENPSGMISMLYKSQITCEE